jgi:hypothetical protein
MTGLFFLKIFRNLTTDFLMYSALTVLPSGM